MKILKNKKGFTLVELLVVIAIIGILIGMLLPAVQSVREAARRIQCGNNMKQLSLSMHNFESANMRFPPGNKSFESPLPNVAFETTLTQPGLNWHVFILPFIEQAPLSDLIDGLSNPHSAYRTAGIATTVISNLNCPSCPMDVINPVRPSVDQDQAKSNYIGVWGIEVGTGSNSDSNYTDIAKDPAVYDASNYSGILFLDSKVGFGEITDGTSNTFVVAERDGASIGEWTRAAATWCGGREVDFLNQCLGPISQQQQFLINTVEDTKSAQWNAVSSEHAGGSQFARADGSVAFVAETIDGSVYEALGTKAGGEVNVNF